MMPGYLFFDFESRYLRFAGFGHLTRNAAREVIGVRIELNCTNPLWLFTIFVHNFYIIYLMMRANLQNQIISYPKHSLELLTNDRKSDH